MDVQDILGQLEVNEGTFPREAVAQAIEQRELIIPELLRILEYAHDNIEDIAERPDYFAHIYAMYLLAEFREVRAYPLLIQFFSTPGEITLDVTGDTVTEDLGRILVSVCDGDIEPITSLIENEQANEFVRYAAVMSLVALVACGEQSRDDIIAYFQSLFRGKLVRKLSHVWDALVSASTDLYPEELIGDIELAYQQQLIDTHYMEIERVQEVLSRDKDDVLFALTGNERFQLIDDAVSEMEWWACFESDNRPSHISGNCFFKTHLIANLKFMSSQDKVVHLESAIQTFSDQGIIHLSSHLSHIAANFQTRLFPFPVFLP